MTPDGLEDAPLNNNHHNQPTNRTLRKKPLIIMQVTTTKTTGEPHGAESTIANADEIMNQHTESMPKAKTGFSLKALMSRDQEVIPHTARVLGGIYIGKPRGDVFVRTSRNPHEAVTFDLLDIDSENRTYLIQPGVTAEINALNAREGRLQIKTVRAQLILTVTRKGGTLLWRINHSDSDNSWLASARRAADRAGEVWVRVMSNVGEQRYDWAEAVNSSEPVWPTESYEDLILKAFEGRIIDSMEHEVIVEQLGG